MSSSAAAAAPPPLTLEQIEAMVGPDIDRGPPLMVLFLTLSIITFLFTAGRLAIRVKARNVGYDDILAMIASVVFVGITACTIIGVTQRTYRHIEYLTLDQISLAIKLNIIEQVLLASTESLGKIAIALMILRIIGSTTHKWHKYFLWTLIISTAVLAVIVDILTWFQCQNPQALWDINLRPFTTCWEPSAVVSEGIFIAVWHTVTDFVLALYPTLLLWDLKISRGKKIALCILLGLGCLTGIFSALKTDQMKVLDTAIDVTYDQYYLQIYACLEMFCLLVLGSVPVYKPVFDRLSAYIASSKVYGSVKSLINSSSTSAHSTPQTDITDKSRYIKRIETKSSQESNNWTSDTTPLTNKSNYIIQDREYLVESHSMDKVPRP